MTSSSPDRTRLLLPPALAAGLLIGWIDSRPTWDDTGVTVTALLLACGTLGALEPRRPWLWALAVGLWIPAFEIPGPGNVGSLVALVFTFAGAYAGMGVRRALVPVGTSMPR